MLRLLLVCAEYYAIIPHRFTQREKPSLVGKMRSTRLFWVSVFLGIISCALGVQPPVQAQNTIATGSTIATGRRSRFDLAENV